MQTLKFLAYHYLDLRDERTWSNIAGAVIASLERRGHDVVVLGPIHPRPFFFSQVKFRVHKRLFNRIYMAARDPRANLLRAKMAMREARKVGAYDAVLCFFLPELADFETDSPIIAIQDATFKQLLDFYDSFQRDKLAIETLRDGVTLDQRGLAKTSHAIYCSQWAADSAISDYGYPREQISIHPLGATVPYAPTRTEIESYVANRGVSKCRFLFLGKEWERKGGPLAVEIVSAIEARGQEVELHVVGCYPPGPLPSFVRVHGPLWKNTEPDATTLRGLFEVCDFFLLPSQAEAFGIVFCEAAAFGMPVIAVNTGGVSAAVSDEWGLLLPSNSLPEASVDWILRAYQDRELYRSFAIAAHTSFKNRLNWDSFTDHLLSVTKDLLERTS